MLTRKFMVMRISSVFYYLRRECLAIFAGKFFATRRTGVTVNHHRLQTLDFDYVTGRPAQPTEAVKCVQRLGNFPHRHPVVRPMGATSPTGSQLPH